MLEKGGVVRSGSERADRRRLQHRLAVPRRRLFAHPFEPTVVQGLRSALRLNRLRELVDERRQRMHGAAAKVHATRPRVTVHVDRGLRP